MTDRNPAPLSGTYIYVRGRELEGTMSDDPSPGIWGVTACRVARGWGNIPRNLLPAGGAWPPSPPPDVDETAKRRRNLFYQRVRSGAEAVRAVSGQIPVSAAFEIGDDWFDAADGEIPTPRAGDSIVGSHAVSLLEYDADRGAFLFANSWGTGWGDRGFGFLPIEYFDERFVCGWIPRGAGERVPVPDPDATQLLTWGLPDVLSDGLVHGAEFYDPRCDERLGWAFAVEREDRLEVEELFVKPVHRGQGLGVLLASAVANCATRLNRSVLAWIPHPDAGTVALEAVERTLARLGTPSVRASGHRWCPLVAKGGTPQASRISVPAPPTWGVPGVGDGGTAAVPSATAGGRRVVCC